MDKTVNNLLFTAHSVLVALPEKGVSMNNSFARSLISWNQPDTYSQSSRFQRCWFKVTGAAKNSACCPTFLIQLQSKA
ncbi:hypothetical protein CY34DRAFT_813898 [Suillus luteus UH-Slu-Lm8-n1]|uniref:Uncharacterized protein n=1 Tax=Suillus luteus UH-Slu-Lm8-n1 TaxID=930992 RepID=A0A0C9Z6D6_9AGAM|nr:hypothetical protein CY34DRAFT_813898 [Suillus luteus UH-Slu-Lm8-n1]